MKTIIFLTLFTTTTLSFAQNLTVTEVHESGMPNKFKNKAAPTFRLETLDNKVVELGDFESRIVLLHFWSLSCSACFKELPELNEIAKKYPKEKFVVLSLMDNTKEELLAKFDPVDGGYIMKKPVYGNDQINFQIVPGAKAIMRLYSDQVAFPQTFILDQSGTVTFYFGSWAPKLGIEGEVTSQDLYMNEIDRLMNASR